MQLQFKFNRSLKRVLAPGDRRLWLLRAVALRIEDGANPLWRFEVFHRRLLIALASLAVAGWLLAVSGLYYWLDRQPHNQVGWFDLAAPWRWSGLRAKRGDTAVLAAMDELKERDYTSAFYNLRVGLARAPGNVEGRLMLARLVAGHDPAQAIALLEEGLPAAGPDTKLIGGLMGLYAVNQMASRGLAMSERLLQGAGATALSPEVRIQLERARLNFLLQLGRSAEAEAAFAAIPPPPTEPGAFNAMRVELLLRTGRPAEAKALSDRLQAEPTYESAVWRQAVEVAVALGDADALQRILRRLKAEAPNSPGAYLLAFQSWHRMKRVSYRDTAEQEYYRLFGQSDGGLQAFAALAVSLDLPEVVLRIQQVARNGRLSVFAFQVHLTEIALRRGDLEAATRYLRSWENNIETLKTPQRFYPEFMKRLVRAAFAGTPDQVSFLLTHLVAARGQAQVATYLLAVTALEKAGNPAGAAEIAQAGLRLYAQCDPLVAAQKRLAEMQAVATVAAGKPEESGTALRIVLLPPDATAARQQFDELLQQDALVAARDLARAIRTQKPDWLPQIEAELAVREVELAYLSLDQLSSRMAARGYLDRHRGEEQVLQLVPLVQRLAKGERLAEARLLLEEITASSTATGRVKQALADLKLVDDSAALLGTPEIALATLDRAILSGEWAQAERLLRTLRDTPPDWLASVVTEVKIREVQVRLGLGQRPLALATFKEIVIKSGAPRSAAFKLVRDLLVRDDSANARLLAREINRLLPGDQAAARLLKEAESPRPAGT